MSSTHPPSPSTSHFWSLRHFPDCFRYHTGSCFPISYFRLLSLPPPLSFSFSLIVSLGPSFPPPPALHPSISRSGSSVFQDGQQPHSHAQNTSVNPTLFSRFEVIVHHRQSHPIPSSISTSICLYLYIDIVHTHLSYNHRLQHRHLYTTSTHSHASTLRLHQETKS